MAPTPPPPALPVGLHVDARRCVVVGGGHVGVRRALQLARCGAEVVLVSPAIWPAAARHALDDAGVEVRLRSYEPGDLDGATLAVAATGRDDVDAAVLADAGARGALTNNVSDTRLGDLSFAAAADLGHIQIAISTDGRTPALTRWIRDRIATDLADGYPELVALFAECRAEMRAAGRPTRHPGWDAALDGGILDQVRAGDLDGARRILRGHLELAP